MTWTCARFALFDADVVPGSDIDIIVRNPGGAVVGTGFSGSSQEEVNLANPAPGTYTVEVSGFSVPAGTSPFKLNSFVLGSTSANNMTVYAPTSVRAGQQVDVWLTPRGLVSGTRYMGSVVYTGTTGLPAPTLVRVDR